MCDWGSWRGDGGRMGRGLLGAAYWVGGCECECTEVGCGKVECGKVEW